MKRAVLGLLSPIFLVAGFLLADGYYHHVEAQSAAETRAALDAGVAAPASGPTVEITGGELVAETHLDGNGPQVAPPAAAPAPPPPAEPDPLVTATEIAEDVKGGNWREVAAGALVLAMFLLRRARELPRSPFKGKRGGAALVMLLGLGTAFTGVLVTDVALTPTLIAGTIGAVFTAVGGYGWMRDILWPATDQPAPGGAA